MLKDETPQDYIRRCRQELQQWGAIVTMEESLLKTIPDLADTYNNDLRYMAYLTDRLRRARRGQYE